jgi:hypothetical protein
MHNFFFRLTIRKLDNRHKNIGQSSSPVSGKHVIEERAGKANIAMMEWKVEETTRNYLKLH